MLEKPQLMYLPRVPNGNLGRKGKITAQTFSGLWRISDPTLFQVTLVAALLSTVLGDCGPPPYLEFAFPTNELNGTNFVTGTVLKYSCRPGYVKSFSKQVLTCERGDTWNYRVFCTKRLCSNPGELSHGHVNIKTDYSFGSHIEFICDEGYVLIGSSVSYCDIQDRGVGWSNPFPECVIAHCKAPPDISNGKHNAGNDDDYTYGFSVTYRCNPGFSMLGQASISCTVENKTQGVWSPSPPTCKYINCHHPEVKNARVVSGFGSTHTYKDSVLFECNRGFVLNGSNIIRCEADNNWDPPPPTCEINSCIGLPDIPHISWGNQQLLKRSKDNMYEVGTVLKYHCYPGYKPAGNRPTTVTCDRNLMWTPHAECQEVCCLKPELNNGEIIEDKGKRSVNKCDYFFGDKISYLCHKKYRSEALCQADGSWSPKTPTCDDNCDYPPNIDHGTFKSISSYFPNNKKIIYECAKGYVLVGQDTLTCSKSVWSSPPPQCKAVCLKPQIEHGKLFEDNYQYVESDNITIQCDPGYGVNGPQNITCLENGTWSPEVPKCEWEVPEGCEQVLKGRRLGMCLPRFEDVKRALELYKLSLEIELLELQRDDMRKSALE